MASITIGGKTHVLPEMNFLAVERAWPYVEKATSSLDPIAGVSAALGVFAASMMEDDNFDVSHFDVSAWDPETSESPTYDDHVHREVIHFLKKGLKGNEMDKVRTTMFEVLKEAGLEVTEGEVQNALVAAVMDDQESLDLSPETAPDTSQSSLPLDAKGDPGKS